MSKRSTLGSIEEMRKVLVMRYRIRLLAVLALACAHILAIQPSWAGLFTDDFNEEMSMALRTTLDTEFATIQHNGANFSIAKHDVINLTEGNVIVKAKRPVTVRCGDQLVTVEPLAVAMISYFRGLFRASVVSGNKINAVASQINNRSPVMLHTGHKSIVGNQANIVASAL